MPSSGYVADTFVAGEQPSTAKWNELWGNDASFNSGNGFNDGILVTRHFATNAVDAANLATSAITIGYAQITSNFTTTTTGGFVDVTNMAVTVTVPAGSRRIEIEAYTPRMVTSGTGGSSMGILEGATILGNSIRNGAAYDGAFITKYSSNSITPGSHTYKVAVGQNVAGTLTFGAGVGTDYLTGGAAYLLVKVL